MLDLSSLNDAQKQAVTAPLGPVLVLAGPGSGKTKTLTFRIAYIIEKRLINPVNILALTFTNKAAKEMRARVRKLLSRFQGVSEQLTMGTFHSVCARILRKEISALGYSPNFTIFDTDDQHKVIREICDDLKLDKKFPPSLFSALISRAKNILQLPSELDLGMDSPLKERLQEVYGRYQDSLFRQNALDFDDLLMLMVKLLDSNEKLLQKYQKQFAYILVDEYQDTNPAQYALLRLLSKHQNLFVVGDDAQSIYGFRGSDITNILNFEKDYPTAAIIKLEQNYRSSKNILNAAQKVIELNSEQKEKTLWTENLSGEKIIIRVAEDERAEAEFVARKIIELVSHEKNELVYEAEEEYKGYSILERVLKARKMFGKTDVFRHLKLSQLPKKHDSLKEYCVLYRTHAQSRALEEVFIESGIPYQIVGGLKFYERKEIKDMLAYLRLCVNFRDLVSLKRVINEPARGIGDRSYLAIRDFIVDITAKNKDMRLKDFREKFLKVQILPKALASAQDFFAMLEDFSSLPVKATLPELLKAVLRRTGMEKFLRDGSEKGESKWENVQELITVTSKFKNLPWKEALTAFLEEVALMAEIDQKQEEKDTVTLMTLHSAKGLEFDNVFFVGLEEGILPHSRSLIDPGELAEEIRLAYVGLTRARKRLFLICAKSRMSFGNRQLQTPSRVLKVLPKECVEFQGLPLLEQNDGEIVVEEMEF